MYNLNLSTVEIETYISLSSRPSLLFYIVRSQLGTLSKINKHESKVKASEV